MKKIVCIVIGVVVIGAVVLIGRQSLSRQRRRAQEAQNKVGHASGLSSVKQDALDAKERKIHEDGADGKGLQVLTPADSNLSGTDGLTGKSAPQELSAPVKSLQLKDGMEHSYSTLMAVIRKLNKNLSSADTTALMEMLGWPNDRFPSTIRPIEINAVKNDVLDKLIGQESLPEGLGLHMVAMAQNADNDPVWRDYCVQFMQPFYERVAAESMVQGAGGGLAAKEHKDNKGNSPVQNGPVNTELNAIREAMFQALEERDATLAGTALIGLENLSRTYDEFDRELITSKAVEITADEMASMESRLTALRLASQVSMEHGAEGMEQTVDAARSLAQDGETVYMRSAAIVTLGEIGSEEDRELLESLSADEDRQISAAANMALSNMDEPESTSPGQEAVKKATTPPKTAKKAAPILVNQL